MYLIFCCYVLDVDECSTNADICHANSTCNNTIGSFMCHCNTGFISNGTYCQGRYFSIATNMWPLFDPNCSFYLSLLAAGPCELSRFTVDTIMFYEIFWNCFPDNNECDNANVCYANSTCNNTIGSFKCICNPGFTANGSRCEGIVKIYKNGNKLNWRFISRVHCPANLIRGNLCIPKKVWVITCFVWNCFCFFFNRPIYGYETKTIKMQSKTFNAFHWI